MKNKEPKFYWFAIAAGISFLIMLMQSCTVMSYIKKNCTIETQFSGRSFICFTCNFDNASDVLQEKIEKRIEKRI